MIFCLYVKSGAEIKRFFLCSVLDGYNGTIFAYGQVSINPIMYSTLVNIAFLFLTKSI